MQPASDTGLSASQTPSRLTIFAFLWACQALVHQEFYLSWVKEGNLLGWILTILAVATLLFPSSVVTFCGMLISSVVFNVVKWPFVVNHILLESIVNVTVLAAIAAEYLPLSSRRFDDREASDRVLDRCKPVLLAMVVIMYYFALISKLNDAFFDTGVSCVSKMYVDLLRRVPFLPAGRVTAMVSIWGTVIIEAAIPLLLTFRRTRYLAILLGVPFHFMLGLVGHRTFSGFAYAIYGLLLIDPLTVAVGRFLQRFHSQLHSARATAALAAVRCIVTITVLALVFADLTGHYQWGIGPLLVYRIPWVIWIAWSIVLGTVYFAIIAAEVRTPSAPTSVAPPRPGLLWIMLLPVVLNGLSPYLGFKTENAFTMYSNLRTEGGRNNHFFMPAFRLAGYQDDLVDVVATDHPALSKYAGGDQYITWFELRRVLSSSPVDCHVSYRRNNEPGTFVREKGSASNAELATPHPILMRKVFFFRPVSKDEKACCTH